jgi:transcriptional regulator with XRE-family HTH domain
VVSVIKERRLELGLTQMDIVARTSGLLNQYRVSIIERGVRPRPDELAALAFALDIPIEELRQE